MPTAEPFRVCASRRGQRRRASADARQQHVGLPVEQRQHLALQALLAERHAGQMLDIDRRRVAGGSRDRCHCNHVQRSPEPLTRPL